MADDQEMDDKKINQVLQDMEKFVDDMKQRSEELHAKHRAAFDHIEAGPEPASDDDNAREIRQMEAQLGKDIDSAVRDFCGPRSSTYVHYKLRTSLPGRILRLMGDKIKGKS